MLHTVRCVFYVANFSGVKSNPLPAKVGHMKLRRPKNSSINVDIYKQGRARLFNKVCIIVVDRIVRERLREREYKENDIRHKQSTQNT